MPSQVRVDGLRVGYRERGDGPPLLLLHGGMSESLEWHRQLDVLSDRWRVVAWDAPGCGESDDPPRGWRLEDYARCVVGVCRELGLERPHVAGLSFGGGLALAVHREAPALTRSLVLLSAYAGWAGSLPPEEVAGRLAACLEASVEPVLPSREDGLAFTGPHPTEDVLDELFAIAQRARTQAVADMGTAFAEADLRPALPTVVAPTLVVVGLEDRRCPPAVGEAIAAAIPQAQLLAVPGAGHVLHQEAPDAVNAAIRAFLTDVERAEAAGSL
ncbi:MAG TPA: alpha/beta hydrolase [Mycobacteriales bacterium]|nr:alpha/beta hydrolase [Mycobacteriales bacterium]